MVVVDASALLPLARIGALRILQESTIHLATTEDVVGEITQVGQPGTAALTRFFDGVDVFERPSKTDDIAEQIGIPLADAAIIELARRRDDVLLGNDRALFNVAQSFGIDTWWIITLLIDAVNHDTISASDAKRMLHELADLGVFVHPRIYIHVQQHFVTIE